MGDSPLVAAYKGAKQVSFAIIATTVVLVAVFIPLIFIKGITGVLFTQTAITLASAVVISSFVALSLSPMIGSKVLRKNIGDEIMVTNGEGLQWNGSISSIDIKSVKARKLNATLIPKTKENIHIAISLIKSTSRMEWFIEKATEPSKFLISTSLLVQLNFLNGSWPLSVNLRSIFKPFTFAGN